VSRLSTPGLILFFDGAESLSMERKVRGSAGPPRSRARQGPGGIKTYKIFRNLAAGLFSYQKTDHFATQYQISQKAIFFAVSMG
jgi:hypothetical protein